MLNVARPRFDSPMGSFSAVVALLAMVGIIAIPFKLVVLLIKKQEELPNSKVQKEDRNALRELRS